MSDWIRVGFIGAGAICEQRHLPGLRAIDGVQVTAVANRSEASSKRVAEQWDIGGVETDWRKLIARDDVDAVFIGTWPYMHREMSIAALEAGKHVFCQARMCMDWDEATAMHEAATARPEQVAMICPPPHRMPWEPFIVEAIASGKLGQVREVQLVSRNGSNLGEQITWRERVAFSGLHALQVGIWAETLNAWVGEYATLSATTATPIGTKKDEDGSDYAIAIPQVVNVHGTLANGAAISEHHSGVALHDHANHVTITGSKATIRVDAMSSIRFAEAGEELDFIDVPEQQQRDWRVERDFIDAVRAAGRGEDWSVDPDFTDGLRYMRKVQAIHASATTGEAVDVAGRYRV